MLIQQLNRNDAERVQISVKNVDGGGSITTGLGVALVITGASIDGISAVKATATLAAGFIGVATQDIAINDFGNVTAFGWVNSVAISNVGTSITVTRGDVLKPGAVAGTFFSSLTPAAMTTVYYKYVVAATTPTAISAAADSYVSGIVRAL